MTGTGTYLYAVAHDGDRPRLTGLTGVAGEPVGTVHHADLIAYVGEVPLAAFGEEPLRAHLQDLAWVEATARAHHAVVEAITEVERATAPVRLLIIYRDAEQVRQLLAARRDAFAAVLERVRGRREWGVKGYLTTAASFDGAEEGDEPDGRPGTAYLRRRQASVQAGRAASDRGAARAEQVHDVLSAIAVAGHLRPPQDPALSGRREAMVLNAAYLVDDGRGDEFAATVARIAGDGVDLEISGPWAPYSFTAVDCEPSTSARDDASLRVGGGQR